MQVKVSVEAGVLLCRNPSVSSASEGKKKKEAIQDKVISACGEQLWRLFPPSQWFTGVSCISCLALWCVWIWW